jgi:flagella basal body P-ring formation protein FlgA
MRLRYVLIACFVAASFGNSCEAFTLSDLITEKAEIEFAHEMPSNGYFKVRLPETGIVDPEHIPEFWMDRKSGKFVAIVVTSGGSKWRINGSATLMVPTPVANRKIMPKEIIREADVAIIDIPFARIGSYILTSKEKIVGMEVRRVLMQGRPIQNQSLSPPIIIARGSRVTIEFRIKSLLISARGKALDDGYLGGDLRVINLESNKSLNVVALREGVVGISKQ